MQAPSPERFRHIGIRMGKQAQISMQPPPAARRFPGLFSTGAQRENGGSRGFGSHTDCGGAFKTPWAASCRVHYTEGV